MSVKPLHTVAALVLGLLVLSGTGCSKIKKGRALDRAEKHYKAGDYEKARIEFLNVLSFDPQNFRSHSSLGKIYFERGQIISALPFLKMARKIQTNDLEIALNLGMSYLAIAERDKAKVEADFVLAKNPTHPEALLLLVDTAATPADITATKQRLGELQKQFGEKASIHLAMANLLMKQRDVAGAQKAVELAEKSDPDSPSVMIAMANIRWSKNEIEEADRLFAAASEKLPIRSSQRFRRVDLKFQTGDIEGAKKLLKEITDKAPDQVPALSYQAKIALAEKKFDECLQLSQKILTLDRVNYDGILLLGRCKLAQKQYAESLKEFERGKTIYARSPELFYYAALAHMGNQEIDKGIVSLTQAISFDASYTPATLLLAEWNVRKGNPAAAIQLLTPVIEKNPKLVQGHLLLATAYRAQERFSDVLAVYEKLVKIFPKDPEPQYMLGWTFREQNRAKEARKHFEAALEMDPKHLRALDQLIDLDVIEKKYDDAWKKLDAELAKNPKSPDLLYFVSKVHMAQKNTEKAEEALNQALEINPAYRPAYLALAEVFTNLKKPEAALEKLQAGIAKNPRDTGSMIKAGMLQEQLKDYAGAAKTYEQMLAVNPNSIEALNNLAYIYADRLNQVEKAYTLIQKAREKAPNDPFCADTYGWILFHRGEYDLALKLIQECTEKAPQLLNHGEVVYHLGMAYYMTGNEALAKTTLARIVDAKGDLIGKETAESCLAVLSVDVSKPGAVAQLEAALEKRPKDFIALLRLGKAQEHVGENEKARAAYEKALQFNPKSVPAIVSLARLHAAKLQNTSKALELAKSARNLAPDDPTVIEMLGPLAYEVRDYPWALTMLQKSAQRNPNNPETLQYLGLCYFGLGKIPEAERSTREALQVSPNFSGAEAAREFLDLISFYAAPEKTDVNKVNNALKRDPQNAPALLVYGLIQEKQQKLSEARQAYEKILARDPQFILAAKHLGILLAENFKEDSKAAELLSKARETLQHDISVARALGMVAFRKGDYTWSAQLLKEVSRQTNSDASVLYGLGIAQHHLKQKVESRENLRQALALNDKDKFAEEARRILNEAK